MFLLLIIIALTTLCTHSLHVSEIGSFCSDAAYDTCHLLFHLTPADFGESVISLPLDGYATVIKEIMPSTPWCTLSNDGKITLQLDKGFQHATHQHHQSSTLSCSLTLNDNINTLKFEALVGKDLLDFPALVHYTHTFEVKPLDQKCSNHLSDESCYAEFTFPSISLPFELETTSKIVFDQLICTNSVNPNQIFLSPTTPSSQHSISITQLPGESDIVNYNFSLLRSLPVGIDSITCRTYWTKSTLSPHFHVKSLPNQNHLFSSQVIVYNQVDLGYGFDCSIKHSNTCTLVYEIPIEIDWSDLSVVAPGFASLLSVPYQCKGDEGHTIVESHVKRYICQRWRKYLRTTSTIPHSITSPSIQFAGRYFGGFVLNLIIDDVQIDYTTPFLFEYDESACNNPLSMTCPIKIKSLHAGPPIMAHINLPYTDTADHMKTSCKSDWMHFELSGNRVEIPGSLVPTRLVPHPSEVYAKTTPDEIVYHECTVHVVKSAFKQYPGGTVHPISFYRDNTAHADLLPTTALTSIEITGAYVASAIGSAAEPDCLDALAEWCTITFTPLDTTGDPLRTFQVSFSGILRVLDDDDYFFEILDPSLNYGDMSLTVNKLDYNHDELVDDITISLGLPQNCHVSTLPRCKPSPGAVTTNCIPPCDLQDPDNEDNPCIPCEQQIWLFTFVVPSTSRINSQFILKYRKEPWTTSYQSTVFFHSYGGLQFGKGFKLGDGELNADLTPNTTSRTTPTVKYYPTHAMTFDGCDNPTMATCYCLVSRADPSINAFWFTLNTELLTNELPGVYYRQVYNDTSQQYTTLLWNSLPPGFDVLDFQTLFIKQLGVNSIIEGWTYEVSQRTITDPQTQLPVTQNYFSGTARKFSNRIHFERDMYPIVENDCRESSSETCHITYNFNSFVTTRSSVSLGTAAPMVLISHYITSNDFIHNVEFARMGTIDDYRGKATQVPPNSVIRDMINMVDLAVDPTCVGVAMDQHTKVNLTWTPNTTDSLGYSVGIITLTLVDGEFPFGGRCTLKLTKKATHLISRKVYSYPLVLFNQHRSTFTFENSVMHSITFPPIQFTRMQMFPRKDCTSQSNISVVCTIDIRFYASPDNPLLKLNTTVPGALRHPLILVSDEPYYLLTETDQGIVRVGHIDVKYADTSSTMVINNELGDEWGWDQDLTINNSQFSPQQQTYPQRSLNLIIYPEFQQKNFNCYVRLHSVVHEIPIPMPSFPVLLALNGDYSMTKTTPYIVFPSSITGVMFLVGANSTQATPSKPTVRLEFTFFHEGLLSIEIDQDFGAYTTPLACYRRLDGTDRSFLDEKSLHENVQGVDPITGYQHEILAWITTDRTTKQSTITPINPKVMTRVTCYTYWRVGKYSKAHNVRHLMHISAQNSLLTAEYFGYYPYYTSSSHVTTNGLVKTGELAKKSL